MAILHILVSEKTRTRAGNNINYCRTPLKFSTETVRKKKKTYSSWKKCHHIIETWNTQLYPRGIFEILRILDGSLEFLSQNCQNQAPFEHIGSLGQSTANLLTYLLGISSAGTVHNIYAMYKVDSNTYIFSWDQIPETLYLGKHIYEQHIIN